MTFHRIMWSYPLIERLLTNAQILATSRGAVHFLCDIQNIPFWFL